MKKSMKIGILLILIILTTGLFLMGCSGKPVAQSDDQVYNLRLATVVSPPHPWIEMAEFFAKEVEKRTDGKVKVSVHTSGTLGNDETTIDEMRLGTIDFVIGGAQNAASFVPEYQVFGLSYLFKDMDHFERVISQDSEIFKYYSKLHDDKKLDLKLLAFAGGGTRNTSNNLRPIVTPDDLRGVKMRLPGSPLEGKLWSALGALPTSLPWNEIYSAIQTGVVNAFESTISGYNGSKLYEVAPFMSKTEHQYMLSHFTMSKATFNKLPEKYQNIIIEVAAQAGVLGTEKGKEFDEIILQELITKYNVKVNEVEKEKFIEKVAPLHDELAKEIKATEILKMIRELQ